MAAASKPSAPYHHGDLRRALVEAATAIVAEEQNWEFSLREVARRAGVSHNAPYRHFPEKLDLLAAIAVEAFDGLGAAMRAATHEADTPETTLMAIGVAYVGYGVDNPARYRLMFGTALGPTRGGMPPLVAEAAASSKAVLSDTLAEGVQQGRFLGGDDAIAAIGFLTLTSWSIMHGLTMLSIDGLSGIDPTEALVERIGQALLEGIRAR